MNIEQFVEVVHLRIETFYLFSRILLDDVVRLVDVLIGVPAGRAIGSHSKLAKGLPALIEARGGDQPPAVLVELIRRVNRVADFRDAYVAHVRLDGVVKGTARDSSGNPAISVNTIAPRPGLPSQVSWSEPIRELRLLLEEYVMAWIDYLVVALPASQVEGVTI